MQDQNTQISEEKKQMSAEQIDVIKNSDKAAFSYVWAMSIVMLILGKDSKYVRYHAMQGLFLFGLSILGFVINPYSAGANKSLQLAVFLLCSWGFANALLGKWKELPIIGALSHGHINFNPSIAHLKEDAMLAKKMAIDLLDDKDRDARLKRQLDAQQKRDIEMAYYEGLEGGTLGDFDEINENVEKEIEENPDLKKQITREEIRRKRRDSQLGHDRYIRYANNISVDKRSKDRLNDLSEEKFIDEKGNIKSKEVPWKNK